MANSWSQKEVDNMVKWAFDSHQTLVMVVIGIAILLAVAIANLYSEIRQQDVQLAVMREGIQPVHSGFGFIAVLAYLSYLIMAAIMLEQSNRLKFMEKGAT